MSVGSVIKSELDTSLENPESLYRERSKKRRYKSKKDKKRSFDVQFPQQHELGSQVRKPGITGRTWTKVEDPHAPRKPRSGYVHFLSSRRSKYGTVKQGCDQKSINVALAAEWQSLSDEQRQPFLDLATKEREQYQIELKAYEQTEHYKEFMEKKERIMRLRKQRRRLSADDKYELVDSMEFDESLLQEDTKSAKAKTKNKNVIESEAVVPTLPNSNIPIFSKEFIEYNRGREAHLRALRREISVAEAERAAMQQTIAKMQANNIAVESQVAFDKRMSKEADHVIESWMRVLRAAMSDTMKEYNLRSAEETVAFLNKLADGDAPNEDVLQAVKEVIHSASFLIHK